jgi:hypothetical protein
VSADSRNRVDFLYVNIGRGHPHYLDGIIECLQPESVGAVSDVFGLTSGLTRRAWDTVRSLYHLSGKSAATAALYSRLRKGASYDRSGRVLALLGRQLKSHYSASERTLVVSHPLLVGLLREQRNLVYQHGEMVVPRESVVRGSHRVVVPTAQAGDLLVASGLQPQQVFVSGLCIEPTLAAQAAACFPARMERLAGDAPLCGAFFTTGAEPSAHTTKLVAAVGSVAQAGGTALVFAQKEGKLASRVNAVLAREGMTLAAVGHPSELPHVMPSVLVCQYAERSDLNRFTTRLFGKFDYFVSAAHERSCWALGLGLPMLLITPSIGSYAPLNRDILLGSRVCHPIESRGQARECGVTVERLRRTGQLARMAQAGWQRYDIDGFRCVAGALEAGDL